MINKVMKNSALCAKVRAMRGKALGDADYNLLMNMPSVTEVAKYLSGHTAYAEAFSGRNVSGMHRAAIERCLREHLRYDIERILPFMDSGARKFMEIFSLEDGISKIKLCLRLIHINHSDKIGEYMSKVSGGKREISADEAEEIGSIDGFIEMMRDTPYYTPLSVFCGKPNLQEPFYMETALDTFWANIVYRYAKKYLTSDEAKSVIKVYGTEFDLQNLTFLLRCKRTFEMTDEEIYASIIPKYYRLKEATISKIVKSASYSDAISVIADETPYGSAFSQVDRFIEKRQNEYVADMKRRMSNAFGYSIQSPICYIHLRRTEIDNIVSIIEGIRYESGAEKIAEYLIGNKGKEARV